MTDAELFKTVQVMVQQYNRSYSSIDLAKRIIQEETERLDSEHKDKRATYLRAALIVISTELETKHENA